MRRLGKHDPRGLVHLNTDAPCALPEDGYPGRVSPELVNIGADPLQSQVLVPQTHVATEKCFFIRKLNLNRHRVTKNFICGIYGIYVYIYMESDTLLNLTPVGFNTSP